MSPIRSLVSLLAVAASSLALFACAAPQPPAPIVPYVPPIPTRVARGPASFVDFAPLFGRALVSNTVRVTGWDPAWLSRVMVSPNVHVPGARESGTEPAVIPDESPAGTAVVPALSGALLRQLVGHGTQVFPPVNLRAWRADLPAANQPPYTWAERALLASRDAGRPTALLVVESLALARTPVDVVLLPDDTGFHVELRGREVEGVCAPMTWSVPTLTLLAEVIATTDGRFVARIDERRSSPLLSRGLAAVEGGARARELVRAQRTAVTDPFLQSFCQSVERQFTAFVQDVARFDHAPEVLRGFLAPALDPLYVGGTTTTPAPPPSAVETVPATETRPQRRRRGT